MSAVSASSAPAGVVSGVISDRATQEPLGFATVQLTGSRVSGDTYQTGMSSDSEGKFRFPRVPAGNYELRVFFIGYASYRDTLAVAEQDSLSFVIALTPEGFTVPAVIVTADSVEADLEPPGFFEFDSEELTALPGAIENDVVRALQFLPGVQAASDISSGLYIRGGGPDQNLILLDNATVYNPSHAFGLFSTFNGDAVDDLQLYKSAYPAEYTGRLGSVLDITSKSGTREGVHGQGGISTISARMLLEGPVGNGTYIIGGRRTYLEPLLNAIRSEENQIPDYYFFDLNGSISQTVGGGVLSVKAYGGQDDLNFRLSDESKFVQRWGNRVIAGQYAKLLSDSSLGKVFATYSRYRSETDIELFNTPLYIENKLQDATIGGDLTLETGERNRVRLGAQFSTFDFVTKQVFNRETNLDFKKTPYDVSVYGENEWESEQGITSLRTGLRARYFNLGDRFLVEPRISGSRRLNKQVTLKAAGGLYYQYLQLVATEGFAGSDFYTPVDETARPGRSIQALMGTSWSPVREYEFSAELYYTSLSRLLSFDNNVPGDQESFKTEDIFVTEGTGYAAGLELFAQKRLGNLRGWLGYTLGFTRRTFAELNGGKEFPPKYDRRHDISAAMTYTAGSWAYSASFLAATGQAYTPASAKYSLRDPATGQDPDGGYVLPSDRNSARLLPYHRLDVSVSRAWRPFGLNARWFVQAFNLYSRRNEWFIQYDSTDPENLPEVVRQLPIIPSLGVTFEF